MRFGMAAGVALAAAMPMAALPAQPSAVPCPAGPVAPPPELAGWAAPVPVAAAADAAGLAGADILVGRAVAAALRPGAALAYPVPPGKAGAAGSYGGLFAVAIERAGTYRVALGAGAWIDLVAGTMAIDSAGHGHGADCSGIRKTVDFALKPGRYTLQLAASAAPTLRLMIVRLP